MRSSKKRLQPLVSLAVHFYWHFIGGVMMVVRNWRKGLKRLGQAALVVVAVTLPFGGYAAYLQVTGNFHPVIEGELYRSAQPSAAQLRKYVQDYGIKTVINLRGTNVDAPWYDQEAAAARDLGVTLIDFGMSARRILPTDRAEQLVALMKTAPKPILVHCQSGSDRTGLVSVLYSREVAGLKDAKAEHQLSFYYGHVGIPHVSQAYAMDESWELIEQHIDRRATHGLDVESASGDDSDDFDRL